MKFPATFLYTRLASVLLLLLFAHDIFSQDTAAVKKTVQKVFYGQASFYANKFSGRKTANGEIFDQKKMTCACNAVKLGTWLKVTNVRTKKSVLVKVNDRIHPRMKRVVDLSSGAAKKIGITSKNGVARVKVEVMGKTKPAE
jgi:rare lipoprotein A